jgi:hypothetical protein
MWIYVNIAIYSGQLFDTTNIKSSMKVLAPLIVGDVNFGRMLR